MAHEPQIRNAIFAGVPSGEIGSLRPHLHYMTLVSGQVLHEPNSPIEDVFFMNEGVILLTANTQNTGLVEVGLILWQPVLQAAVLSKCDVDISYSSIKLL